MNKEGGIKMKLNVNEMLLVVVLVTPAALLAAFVIDSIFEIGIECPEGYNTVRYVNRDTAKLCEKYVTLAGGKVIRKELLVELVEGGIKNGNETR